MWLKTCVWNLFRLFLYNFFICIWAGSMWFVLRKWCLVLSISHLEDSCFCFCNSSFPQTQRYFHIVIVFNWFYILNATVTYPDFVFIVYVYLKTHKWPKWKRVWFVFWLNVNKFQLPKYIENNDNLSLLDFASFLEFRFPCIVWKRFITYLLAYYISFVAVYGVLIVF